MARQYWLCKTEPNVFALADLKRCPHQTTCWDGVRNYQARNMLRDSMGLGDGVLLYHSRVAPMAVVGLAEVVRAGYPDPSQWQPQSAYFDPTVKPATPRWYSVDIQLQAELPQPVTLQAMRQHPGLQQMALLRPNSRLSVQPVQPAEWQIIVQELAGLRLGGLGPR